MLELVDRIMAASPATQLSSSHGQKLSCGLELDMEILRIHLQAMYGTSQSKDAPQSTSFFLGNLLRTLSGQRRKFSSF